MKYYYFTLEGSFSMVLDEYVDFGSQLIMVASEVDYGTNLIRLHKGNIERYEIESVSSDEVEEYIATDSVTQDILSALAEINETILSLQGGKNDDNF